MPLSIVYGDITTQRVDAIVNAANQRLLPGGGVCGAIFSAAGEEDLWEACRPLAPVATGEAVMTPGFRLPARYVIHTPGPVWRGGQQGEHAALASCYKESLRLAASQGLRSVAFPLISSGIYGFPADQAQQVAMEAIGDYLLHEDQSDMTVLLVRYAGNTIPDTRLTDKLRSVLGGEQPESPREKRQSRRIGLFDWLRRPGKRAESWQPEAQQPEEELSAHPHRAEQSKAFSPWDDGWPGEDVDAAAPDAWDDPFSQLAGEDAPQIMVPFSDANMDDAPCVLPEKAQPPRPMMPPAPMCPAPMSVDETEAGLRSFLQGIGRVETLGDHLVRLIDERHLKDSDVYRAANMDRRLFSKIRSQADYKPRKETVFALCVALKLDREQAAGLLAKAGYAFSDASPIDLAVGWYLEHGDGDVFALNLALAQLHLPQLGSAIA